MKPALFETMSNEELLEAISDAMAEARRRRISHAAERAAFGITRKEIQKRREQAKEQAYREKQIKNWTKKRELALLIQEALGKEWSLNVWNKDDKRVYIDGLGRRKIIYYCEGNYYNPPGKLEAQQIKLTKEQKEILLRACRKADEDWQSTRFSVDEAAAWKAPRPLGVEEHDIDIEIEV